MENKGSESFLTRIENIASYITLFFLALLPFCEIITRKFFKTGIYGSSEYIQHLVLWITFLGGMITTREKKHLSLALGIDLIKNPYRTWIMSLTSFITIVISASFTLCALSFAIIGFEPGQKAGLIPIQIITFMMPLSYGFITYYFIKQCPQVKLKNLIVFLALFFGVLIGFDPLMNILRSFLNFIYPSGGPILDQFNSTVESLNNLTLPFRNIVTWPAIIILIISTFMGTPIFIVLGGLGLLFFTRVAGSLEVISNEAYTMLTNPAIPALPLFTLAGFILSESKAGERLVKFFQALLSWLPGGLAIMTILICAFFTTFTGASGITILALGGLLAFILINNQYPKKFTQGLLTASGSIGLLFPPSLPVIMYGVIAQINIKKIYVAGVLPGIMMLLPLIILGVYAGLKYKVPRIPFSLKGLWLPFKSSIWEILLPVIIILGYFNGIISLVETGAVAVIYSLIVEMFVHKDIKPHDLARIFLKSTILIGGVLIILAGAKALSYYIVDMEVPVKLTQLCQTYIHSKYVFLILLNVALLIVGCFMDIYSAIIVVVPLILPLGRAYGIDPFHLGIIFLANLQLGYLTPPVGLNLYLASYTFEEPLVKIYRNVVIFLVVLLVDVLLITYLPWFTSVLLGLFKF